MTQRFAEAVRLLMSATDHLEKIGGNESLLRELDSFIRSVHPLECGPRAVSEERRVAAWRSKNHLGVPIAITVEDLALQPHYVKEMWQNAEPLYVSSTSAAGGEAK